MSVYTFTDVSGITWRYKLNGGYASIGNGGDNTTGGNATNLGTSISGGIVIPSTIGGYTVTDINQFAFFTCSNITSVTIPSSVTNIGAYAFRGCNNTNFKSVTIPDSVVTISLGAFEIMSGLTSVTIGNSVKTMGDGAFKSAINLKSLTIPDSVTFIDVYVFYNCTSLTSVTIGNSLKTIGNDAFGVVTNGTSNLTSINIPDSVTSIGTNAFYFNNPNLVIAMSANTAVRFSKTSPSSNQSFFGGTSIDFVPPPTMTIESTTAGVTSGSTTKNASIALRFTSSASTTDFLLGDISFNNGANGTLSDFAGSGTVYTATFTPAGQGLCTINVLANKFTSSGVNNTASNTFTWTYDSISPTMVISSNDVANGSTTNKAIALTFTSSETTNNFAVEDITVTNGTLSYPLGGSGSVYTATFTPMNQGLCTIDVSAGVYTDAATNLNNLATQFSFTYDTVPPTMTIQSTTVGVSSGSTTNNASIALRFTSSKATNNFALGDISFTNGANGTLSDFAGSGSVYNATFTPAGQGICTIDVSGGVFTDAAGNNNTASNTFTWTFDNVSPSMDISSTTVGVTRGSTTNNTSIALTFTSSETTNNFAVGGISVTNGTLSNFAASSGTDGKVYTATFTPTTAGLCTIGVAAGVYTDTATNLNNLATQFTWTFDNVAPTMTITSTTSGVTSGSTIDNATIALTFTSSKSTTNFAVEDISVTNGTLSSPLGGSGSVYTATFTPARQGLCTINVASGAYTDAVGNNNAAANTFSVVYIPKFALFNNANNLEQTYIAGFLDVSGNINHRSRDLTVTDGNLIVSSGNVSLNSGNLNMGGNVSINSGLMVNGPTTLPQMAASGNIDVSGATTLVGAVSVSGLTTFNNNVSISNNKNFTVGSGTTILGGDVSMNSALKVAGDVSLNSTLAVNGLTTLANTSIAGTLVVNGKSTFTTDMSFTAVDVDICGNLRAQYPASSIPLVAIIGGGSLTATDVSMNTGLSVAGATTVSTLTANGNAAIGGALAVTGASTLAALTTTGDVTLGNTLVVTEKTVFATDVSFGVSGSRVDICGNLYANYPANSIPATAIVSSSNSNTDISMNAKLSVAGATTLASTLVVAGKTTFLNDVSFGISGSRVDICGNLYANYAGNSIAKSAIIGGIGGSNAIFNADVNMNAGLYVQNSIKIDTAQMQYRDIQWNRMGGDIDGQPSSLSGMFVSLSNDGSRVAIGNRNQNMPIRVYTRDLSNATIGWSRLGGDITFNFTAGDTYYAHNVVLSGDGSVVAIYTYSTLVSTVAGKARAMVFRYQSGSWVKLGNTFNMNSVRGGNGIALSNDGLTIAVGDYRDSNYGGTRGTVYVWNYDGSSWLSKNLVYGGVTDAGFGWSVALSSNGNILAVGAVGDPNLYRGYVTVFSYNGTDWSYVTRLNGSIDAAQLGAYVSLSGDGTTLAVSTIPASGITSYARAYRYNGSSWNQVGSDFSMGIHEDPGLPIALSRDGTILAIGSYINDGTSASTSNNIGATFVYRCPVGSSTWTQIGTILGETSGDYSGSSVSLSGDGSIVAIGAINNDGTSASTSNNSGQVRVYSRDVYRVAPGLDISATLVPTSLNSADLTIRSTLNVSGSTTLAALTSGSTNVGGTLRVTGATTTATLVAGNTNIGGTLYVGGATTFPADVSINSTLTVASDVSINSPLFVGNDTTLNSTLFVNRDVSLNSTLFVNGATTLAGAYASTLSVTGATTIMDTAYVTGNSTIDGVLTFALPYTLAADASLNSNLTVARDVSLNSTLNVTRATTLAALAITNNMTLNSTLSVTNATTIMADVSANAQLLVTNAATLNSTMSVATTTNLGGTMQVTGATTVSTLTASGITAVGGTLTVNGKTSISGNVTFNSNTVDVSGNLRAGSLGFPSGGAVVRYGPLYDWVQIGNDIDGETASDESGWSTALSADGKTVAIGARSSNSTTVMGHVRVYSHNSNKTTNVTNQNVASFGPVGWTRVGNDIDGEANSDNSGYSVSLSADGSTVAIGAINNDGTVGGTDNRGHVRVYKINAENTTIAPIGWTKLGNDIDGEAAADNSGVSVSLSADGTIVAIGAEANDGTSANSGDNRGHVRVYQYISQTWTKLGGDIDGEATGDSSGKSVSISSDGTNIIVAIGAPSNSPAGHVRVYKYRANKSSADSIGPIGWDRLGADIDGEAGSDSSGVSVSLVANWPNVFVAIGANVNDGTVGGTDNRGHVRVYQYVEGKVADTNQSSSTFGPAGWKRLGADIDGETGDDRSGHSVSLAANWPTSVVVAIGAYSGKKPNTNICGHVRVYKYRAEKDTAVADESLSTFGPAGWDRLGTDIDGEAIDDRFGWSVSLSADGLTVAAGANLNDGNGDKSGHVRVFKYLPIGLYANTAIISTNATTTGDVTLYDAFNVARATSLTGTLSVAGASTVSTMNTSSNASVGGTLTVSGATTSGGTLNVSGATTSTTMTLSSNALIGGTLVVSGAATMQSLNLTGPIKKC